MISVGLRLTDQVFPGPEEPIAKLPTANENPEMILDGIDKNTGKAVIKRIVLSRTANVELLRAESPSRIWVRLPNHITDTTLTFREPFELKPKTAIVKGDYAVAPIAERTFRRCRILETANEYELIKIFFIDDATTAFVKKECLAEMDEHYMFYPWQAIQISLFGVYPAIGDGETESMWSVDTCFNLAEILLGFSILRVEVVLSTVVFNDYARPIPVKLFGIEGDQLEEKEHKSRSVEVKQILEKKVPTQIVSMDLHDAAFHEIYEVAETVEIPEDALDIHQCIPADWKHKDEVEMAEKEEETEELFNKDSLTPEKEHEDWDPRQNKIEMPTIEELAEKTGKNEREENLPWTSQKDTEEFKEVDLVDWILYGNDQLTSFAEQLDNYYSNAKNRKPLRREEIQNMRKENREVFAVCAVNEEKANYTGEWQRVLIVNCDEFAEVRFLDSGGRDMVLTSSLYRIHKQHCRFPPMCLRFSIHGVSTKINSNMAPMVLPQRKDPRPYFANYVLMVKNVSYIDESATLMDRFLDTSEEGCAMKDPNEPIPWTR
ncbi:hypothetical protein CAEBREN_12002 [Caenorhabditis brenneri]|uniref:Tudor domain-containing protein n=1 Tax=Caenorhabditis brenneri TaxID=135651 RepID=G0NWM6_CAEBE|nr:hypothetical protein CAEBREN_12002 [Caenorhabditis brenneri]